MCPAFLYDVVYYIQLNIDLMKNKVTKCNKIIDINEEEVS